MYNIFEYGLYMGISFYSIFYMYMNKTRKYAKPNGYDYDVSFQYLTSIGTNMSVIFENEYKWEYSFVRPKSAPFPSLWSNGGVFSSGLAEELEVMTHAQPNFFSHTGSKRCLGICLSFFFLTIVVLGWAGFFDLWAMVL